MKKVLATLAVLSLITALASCAKETRSVKYPVTKTVDQVDDYFGVKVPDPYRWLEDDNAAEVKEWVLAQNEVTFGYLAGIPFREKIRSRLTDIYNYPRYSSPIRAGEYYFFTKNDGLQNQSVIYVQKGLDGTPEVFLDPNILSADGTARVGFAGFSPDFRYVSIVRSEAGSDWSELRAMEVATKRELPDVIRWLKFSPASWLNDGFFYSGYEKPAPGQELTAKNESQKVYFHRLGDPQEKDTLVYEDREHPLRYLRVSVSEDLACAFLSVSEGTSGNELHWKSLAGEDAAFKPLIRGFEGDSSVVENVDGKFLVHTNLGAPNYRVVRIDPADPAPEKWVDVIPEGPDVLTQAGTAGGQLFCARLKDVLTRYTQYALDGKLVREIELPGLGTVGGFGGWKDDTTVFYTFTSYTNPPTIFKYDVASGASEVFRKAEVKFDPADYETKQVFYASADGTKVPMFIVHRKGLELDGKNPAYLTAYGGFNSSVQPVFNPSLLPLLENGGVFAEPALRGGGEYGEAWHKAGMLLNKTNVFDDFIAAAEYLIREKYTTKDLLAIEGGSNGGLLVGAAMTRRPDLFRVAFPAVGVMDMLRYHKFTVGWGWVVEYGSSDNEKDFPNLYGYSPLHNIKPGVCYPATLVTTADHDDRVIPAHSFKFAAALQAAQACSRPALIRIETRSGHGSSNVTKAIDLLTDQWSFMFHNMKVVPNY
jgi:prolyl oligopeptidase